MVGSLLAGSLLGGMGLAAASSAVPGHDQARAVAAAVGLVDDDDNAAEAAHDAAEEAREAAEEAADAAKDANEPNEEAKAAKTESDDDHGVTRSYTDCPLPGDKTGTHGQYVSSVEDNPLTTDVNEREVAAKSDCGKPDHSDHPATTHETDDPAAEHRQNGDHPARADNGEHGQSDADHPDDNADEHAGDAVSGHRPDTAGQSAGHGPGGD